MKQSIDIMKESIIEILYENDPSIYLYGSVVLDDFKLGWSDIDIVCLTRDPITEYQAEKLVNLRQELMIKYEDDPYLRLFEGELLSVDALINKASEIVVYWGTSGQRITDKSNFDAFAKMELLDSGVLLYGDDIRDKMKYPTNEDIKSAIAHHYNAIRKYAVKTSKSIYSVGWLLDIARGLYTLQTGKIIAKTAAGNWTLEKGLTPDISVMLKALEIRKDPNKYKNDNDTLVWAETMGEYIQRFADVLEFELKK